MAILEIQWPEERQRRMSLEYTAYMDSPAWQLVRACKLSQVAFYQDREDALCEQCLDQKATQVHHLTYCRFMNEDLRDLMALCKDCHEAVHTY